MKEYRPIVLINPLKKYYFLGVIFLFFIIYFVFQGKHQIGLFRVVSLMPIVMLIFIIKKIIEIKYAVLVRFDDKFLRIEYLDYRKRSFFVQIPYSELSANISIVRAKYKNYAALKIALNGKKVISIDENNSNFSRTEISDIYKDILKINPSNG